MTIEEIINSEKTLYMNSPVGYPFAQKIEHRDVGNLKSFLINTTPDELLQQQIRDMSHEAVIEAYLLNNFTFDEEWYGARLLDWQKER